MVSKSIIDRLYPQGPTRKENSFYQERTNHSVELNPRKNLESTPKLLYYADKKTGGLKAKMTYQY